MNIKTMLRQEWFNYVAKTRRKLQRLNKDKKITHQEAMAEASKTWRSSEKLKVLRRIEREKKKALKREAKKAEANPTEKDS